MKCWFIRDPGSDWESGLIVGYISPASAVVKVDKRGELLSLPLDQVSYGDNKPADGHNHYLDPRYIQPAPTSKMKVALLPPVPLGGVAGSLTATVSDPPEVPKPFVALTADSLRKASSK